MKRPDDDIVGQGAQSVKDEPSALLAAAAQPEAKKLILGLSDGTLSLNNELAIQAFGSEDDGFIKGIMNQVLQLSNDGKGAIDPGQMEFITGALLGIKPKDELEAMLAAQILANHVLTMKFAGKLFRADTFNQQEAIEKVYTKLARTTPAQMEALHRKRHGGKQKVKVEHVHVHEGGQAIVGNVETGGGVGSRNQT